MSVLHRERDAAAGQAGDVPGEGAPEAVDVNRVVGDAFVGAGAVVTKDVERRMLVVGNPARVMRGVPQDELLENQ